MSEFHDPELRQELGRLSGPYPDDNAAFAAWQQRVGQVRRRRAVAWTTGAAMSMIIAVVAYAAMHVPNQRTVVPGNEAAETSATVPPRVAPTIGQLIIDESTAAPTTAATTTSMPDTVPASEAVETSMPDNALPADTTPPTTHKPAAGTTAPPAAATTPTTEADQSHSDIKVDSVGGTVTVRQDKGRLIVVDIKSADGFHAQQTGHFDHFVFVTFTSQSHRSDITIRLDHGQISNHVDERTETHADSAPGGSYGGAGGGSGGD
jgi:hypothetical protein